MALNLKKFLLSQVPHAVPEVLSNEANFCLQIKPIFLFQLNPVFAFAGTARCASSALKLSQFFKKLCSQVPHAVHQVL
jgi:hypothetical protein